MKNRDLRVIKYRLKRKKRFFSTLVLLFTIGLCTVNSLGSITTKPQEMRYTAEARNEESHKDPEPNPDSEDAFLRKDTAEKEDTSHSTEKSEPGKLIEMKIKKISKSKYLILINKKHNVKKDYVPENLRELNVNFLNSSNKASRYMESTAAQAFEKLCVAAGRQGINLLAVSGYRSYSYQKSLYDRKVKIIGKTEAEKFVAPPGESEHQTGLAMDVVSDEYKALDEGFCKTKAYKWFKENASEFGFIIRYPEGKENITTYNFEPWHLRYVGTEAAKEIVKQGVVLEELFDYQL